MINLTKSDPLQLAVERAIHKARAWRSHGDTEVSLGNTSSAMPTWSRSSESSVATARGIIRWVFIGDELPNGGRLEASETVVRAARILAHWLEYQPTFPEREILERGRIVLSAALESHELDQQPDLRDQIRVLEVEDEEQLDDWLARRLYSQWQSKNDIFTPPLNPKHVERWRAGIAGLPALVVTQTLPPDSDTPGQLTRALTKLPAHGSRGSAASALSRLERINGVKHAILYWRLHDTLKRQLHSSNFPSDSAATTLAAPKRQDAERMLKLALSEIQKGIAPMFEALRGRHRVVFNTGMFSDDSKRMKSRLRFVEEEMRSTIIGLELRASPSVKSELRKSTAHPLTQQLVVLMPDTISQVLGAPLELVVTQANHARLHIALPCPSVERVPHRAVVVKPSGHSKTHILGPGWQIFVRNALRDPR